MGVGRTTRAMDARMKTDSVNERQRGRGDVTGLALSRTARNG